MNINIWNIWINLKKILVLLLLINTINIYTQDQTNQQDQLDQQSQNKDLVSFNFKEKKLIEIIDLLTEKKKVNYILPQKANDVETLKNQTISYQPQENEEITVQKAWNLVSFFLELSGFSIFKRDEKFYEISPIAKSDEGGISRQPLPLYISTPPHDLPNTQERIRYVVYFANLDITADKNNPINQIISDMSSLGAAAPIVLTRAKGIILVDKANVIASIITILSQLDATGFRETIEVVPLFNVPAKNVATVFETLKKAVGEDKTSPFIRANTNASISYFASDTQIVPDILNNKIILMGRQTAVERISDFIQNYVDIQPQSGRSILHSYNLQYLSATEFAPILQEIVKTKGIGSQADQSTINGPTRFFQGVVVEAEKIEEVKPGLNPLGEDAESSIGSNFKPQGITGYIQTGGNRLIIAANWDDWLKVKDLISKLDHPQPQVILEVFIVDFVHNEVKAISGSVRNPEQLQLPGQGIDFLASHITPVNNVLGKSPVRLAEDLLQLVSGSTNPAALTSLIATANRSPLLLSFNDPATLPDSRSVLPGGIFGLIEILDQYIDTRIISHPYLISTNNQKATITQSQIRRARGSAKPVQSGVIKIDIQDIPASIQAQLIPRISSPKRLGLQVAVDIDDFEDPNNFNRVTRRVEANVNINSGEILVMGGLADTRTIDSRTSTPILSRLPIIGRFFSGISKEIRARNIAIFISPTIVKTRLRDGLNKYTKDKIRKSRRDIDDDLIFGETEDPIVHIFFKNNITRSNEMVKEFISQTSNAPTFEEIKTSKEKRLAAKRGLRPVKPVEHNVKEEPIKKDQLVKEIIA